MHCALIEHPHEAHADSLLHLGRFAQQAAAPTTRAPHRVQGDAQMQVPQVRQGALQRMRLRSPMTSVPQTKEKQREERTKRE